VWWRILGKQGYGVVTNRRMFIVHADGTFSGRTPAQAASVW
jgi:hypothetical protein